MKQPNILFIICDDLGINDLRCYGREDHNTPNLDRLARQGGRFTSAYASSPLCSPSRAGLMTGMHPARLHMTNWIPGREDLPSQRVLHPKINMQIPLTTKTWPRYFKEAGYVTGFIGKWHIGKVGPAEHGFDYVYYKGEGGLTEPSETEGGKAEYELTREAVRFIKENKDVPFVAYLAHYTPHIPYTCRQALIEKNKDAFEPVYAGLIEELDNSVGLLLETLDELELTENTIVVFTSDNGGLHVPELNHTRITHNTPFRAGKGHVYEGGQRVPTIVRWPGRVPEGLVIDTPVNNTGWIPTLLELAGKQAPAGLDGRSFAEGLLGGPVKEEPIFWHFPHYTGQGARPSGAMRDGDWLLVERYDEDRRELYNLANDIGERQNLAAEHPDRVANMAMRLDVWRKALDVQCNAPNPDCREDLFKQRYVDVDPSSFDPLNATDADWERMKQWSAQMNVEQILEEAKQCGDEPA